MNAQTTPATFSQKKATYEKVKTRKVLSLIQKLAKNNWLVIRYSDTIQEDIQRNETTHPFTEMAAESHEDYWTTFLEIISDYHLVSLPEIEEDEVYQTLESVEIKEGIFRVFAHDGLAGTLVSNEEAFTSITTLKALNSLLHQNSWEGNGQKHYVSFDAKESTLVYSFGSLHLFATPRYKEREALHPFYIQPFE